MVAFLIMLPILALAMLFLPRFGIEFAPITALADRLGTSTQAIGWLLATAWGLLIIWNAFLSFERAAEKRRLMKERESVIKLASERVDRKAELFAEIARLRNDPALDEKEREEAIQRLTATIDWLLSDDTP